MVVVVVVVVLRLTRIVKSVVAGQGSATLECARNLLVIRISRVSPKRRYISPWHTTALVGDPKLCTAVHKRFTGYGGETL